MVTRRISSALGEFLESEAAGGLILIGAAALALIIANSTLASTYFGVLASKLGPLSVLHWINDGLMALFFLLIGLEMKRELSDGQLAGWPDRMLPGIAAASGMAVPALIYALLNRGSGSLQGWAIPAATDIAFALGILALLGKRVPPSLKMFLLAVAIIDDLGAVLIIAAFYTAKLSFVWLMGAGGVVIALAALNRAGVHRLWPYLLLGVVLWFCVLRSGVHPTMAGAALAFLIPLRADEERSPLHRLEHALSPWVGFAIVPLFGIANAGVSLAGVSLAALAAPVPLGIAAGLFVGKQLGIFGSVWAAIRLRLAAKPEGASVVQIYGVAVLCGVGFTMSLFIGQLAFPAVEAQGQVKIGVLLGSLLSAVFGLLILALSNRAATRRA
jgi:NhaA family Na+:H+ antiporter